MVAIRRSSGIRVAGRSYSRGKIEDSIRQEREPSVDSRKQTRVQLPRPTLVNNNNFNHRLLEAYQNWRTKKLSNLAPILPLLLNIKGAPFTLDNHFVFEPFYNTMVARRFMAKTGRQTSKSTNAAAQGVIRSATHPYFNTLYITPLFEMVRRLSSNYVKDFIESSPVRALFMGTGMNHNVLQRTFANRSTMFFSFAFLDAERTRGLNCDQVSYDEVQDLDRSFIPIIREVLSGSKYGFEQYTGTPKTLENTCEQLWTDSSQAEWVTKCRACGHYNIPRIGFDLDLMMGPNIVERKISNSSPAVVCAKCARPINPREGRWVHAFPDLRFEFPGYHVPQCILPMHYAKAGKWAVLLGKRQGHGNTPVSTFYNESCGESYDSGTKLVSLTELRAAATLHENTRENGKKASRRYTTKILAVDWGGGGIAKGTKLYYTSYTTAAVLGLTGDGKVHTIYGWRSPTPHDYRGEAYILLRLMEEMECSHLVSDHGGAGDVREQWLVDAGLDASRLIPVSYQRATAGPLMQYKEPDPQGKRGYYQLDKARSLSLTCELIRYGGIHFFQYDYKGTGQPGLLRDFTSLVEDKVSSRAAGDIYTIIRDERIGPDDFAHSVNMGSCALFYMQNQWPDIAALSKFYLTREQDQQLNMVSDADWLF